MPPQKSTPQKSSGSRKTPTSSGSVTDKARSAASSAARGAKSAASSVKSAAGAVGGKVARGAKNVKKSAAGLSKGQLIAGAAGLAAAATAAGAVLYKTKGGSGNRTVYHVKPDGEGWVVKGDGAERAVSTHDTKKEALTAARELAHGKAPSQLVVHKSDGSVQEKFSYDTT